MRKNKHGNYVGKKLGFIYLINNEVAIITKTLLNREYQLYMKFKKPRLFWLLRSVKIDEITAISSEYSFPSYEDYKFKHLIRIGEV